MINLLSSELQTELRAARLNVRLRSYIFVIAIVLGTILLVFAAGLLLSYQHRLAAEEAIKDNRQSISQYEDTRKAAERFHGDLAIAKAILSQETLYSDLTVRITQTLPSNTILTSLLLDEQTITQPIIFSARVPSQQSAVTLKNTLENSAIFSEVSLINIQEDKPDEKTDNIPAIFRNHPVAVTFQATLEKDAVSGGKL